jgi:hypothetical protein
MISLKVCRCCCGKLFKVNEKRAKCLNCGAVFERPKPLIRGPQIHGRILDAHFGCGYKNQPRVPRPESRMKPNAQRQTPNA